MQKLVDDQILEVLDALESTSFSDETIVILSSDHGELTGSHSKGIEKWHNAYEEVLHVPMVINGKMFESRSVGKITSHIDVLPTIIALTDKNEIDLTGV